MADWGDSYDFLIVGGGVIGLSLAWELAQHGAKVGVVDRGPLGGEASWAGAGMVPPGPVASMYAQATEFEQLEGLSQELHEDWHAILLDKTGIDNEYRQCGAIQLAQSEQEHVDLLAKAQHWRSLGIICDEIDARQLADLEPALTEHAGEFAAAYHLPDEAQIRNPRHLQALISACQIECVQLMPNVEVHDFQQQSHQITEVNTNRGTITADQVCLASGCWSGKVAKSLGFELPIRPIRGQIALLDGPPGLLTRNISVGPRYLVPRRDGRLLIGSTQEDVGFDVTTTGEEIEGLRDFAASLAPTTAALPLEQSWAGLRPSTPDNQPYLGRLPGVDNAWIAAGHFRAGLQLSPATAVVMRAMMLDQESPIDSSQLRPERALIHDTACSADSD